MNPQQGLMVRKHRKVVETLEAQLLTNTKEEATKNTEVKANRLQ
jgi:hypothetical protein